MQTELTNYHKIKNLLKSISMLKDHCRKRGLEKMGATSKGFGEHNYVEGIKIKFNTDEVIIIVIGRDYDLREEVSESLGIDEIAMSEDAWKAYLAHLEEIKIQNEEANKTRNEATEKEERRQVFLKLKQEFEGT